MSDIRVPVKSWLRGDTYRALDRYAKQHGVPDVGSLLAALADKAVGHRPPSNRRKWVRMTPARLERLRELHDAGTPPKQIAVHLGVSRSSVDNYLKELP